MSDFPNKRIRFRNMDQLPSPVLPPQPPVPPADDAAKPDLEASSPPQALKLIKEKSECTKLLDMVPDVLIMIFNLLNLSETLSLRLISKDMKAFVETHIFSHIRSLRIDPEVDSKDKDSYDVCLDNYEYFRRLPNARNSMFQGAGAVTSCFQNISRLAIATRFGVSLRRMQMVEFLNFWSPTLTSLKLTLDVDLSPAQQRREAQAELWEALNDLTELKNLTINLVSEQWVLPENIIIFPQLEYFEFTYFNREVDFIVSQLVGNLKELKLDSCTIRDADCFQSILEEDNQLKKLILRKDVHFSEENYLKLCELLKHTKGRLVKLSFPVRGLSKPLLPNLFSQLKHCPLEKLTLKPLEIEQLVGLKKLNLLPVLPSVEKLSIFIENIKPRDWTGGDLAHLLWRHLTQTLEATLPKTFPNLTSLKLRIEITTWNKSAKREDNELYYNQEDLLTALSTFMPRLTSKAVVILVAGEPVQRRLVIRQRRIFNDLIEDDDDDDDADDDDEEEEEEDEGEDDEDDEDEEGEERDLRLRQERHNRLMFHMRRRNNMERDAIDNAWLRELMEHDERGNENADGDNANVNQQNAEENNFLRQRIPRRLLFRRRQIAFAVQRARALRLDFARNENLPYLHVLDLRIRRNNQVVAEPLEEEEEEEPAGLEPLQQPENNDAADNAADNRAQDAQRDAQEGGENVDDLN